MFVDHSTLANTARVWIYPSSRKFYPTEVDALEENIKNFVENWKSDAPNFKASYQFLYNRFIILMAEEDEVKLSQSDIDTSVNFILALQGTYDVTLLDRMNVCFKQGEFVQYKELVDFKKLIKDKALTAKTIVFDNLVATKAELDAFWEIPLEESWYRRFL